MTPLAQEKKYTYAGLLERHGGPRFELYDGQPVALASPSTEHQQVSMALSAQLYNFLKDKTCRVFTAPFDVRLFQQDGDSPEDVYWVLQPDISVICDTGKLDSHGCKGAPDLIVEILSPATQRHDRLTKFNLYQQAGVQEYWIVDPEARVVLVHILEEGKYHSPAAYNASASVPVGVLPGCTVELPSIFS